MNSVISTKGGDDKLGVSDAVSAKSACCACYSKFTSGLTHFSLLFSEI